MKKYFLLLLLPLLFSCNKDKCGFTESSVTASAGEIADLQTYLNDHSITATQHSSGFFYKIDSAGTGGNPGICSIVTVKYTGKLTNGNVFDSNTIPTAFYLGQLIVGWQKGIPLIKAGGKITLYIPPSMGYGSHAVGSIPANSILIFDINLERFE